MGIENISKTIAVLQMAQQCIMEQECIVLPEHRKESFRKLEYCQIVLGELIGGTVNEINNAFDKALFELFPINKQELK